MGRLKRSDPRLWSSLDPDAVEARRNLKPQRVDFQEVQEKSAQSLCNFTHDLTCAFFGFKPFVKKLLPGRA
ncbi:hypothetical protein KW798_03395 [Candidatus Parcubacteria bacterium]|nr:hypothetical protein [Candidatus Parcubacteria bacterium]